MSSYHARDNGTYAVHLIFSLLVVGYLVLGYYLLWHIPYTYPYGGPDELMHLSMADYIAKHLEWPRWDSTEVVRNAYGVSYSAGGSIVYWLHGLCYKLFGVHRIGGFVLLVVYVTIAVFAYVKNRLAGFLLIAGLLPQTLFIFSYVNSDSGTVVTALVFGIAAGIFLVRSDRLKYLLLFFFFAGAAVTARQHLWAIAFLTFVWVLVYKRRSVMRYEKKYLVLALLLALLPASWWFVTSYIANDGDILGVFTNAKSIAKFGQENLPVLARDWKDISLYNFVYSTLVSLYANWGWLTLGLSEYWYAVAAVLAVIVIALSATVIDTKVFLFFLFLVAANLGFMLLYSTFYDYQAQGRYLFPSVYIILGMIVGIVYARRVYARLLLGALIALSTLNLSAATYLTVTSYVDAFLQKPKPWSVPTDTTVASKVPYHIDQAQIIDGKLSVRGWVYDAKTGKPFDEVFLVVKNDRRAFRIDLDRTQRPDVAAAFANPSLQASGFSVKLVDLRSLPKGEYRYYLGVEENGKTTLVALPGRLKI